MLSVVFSSVVRAGAAFVQYGSASIVLDVSGELPVSFEAFKKQYPCAKLVKVFSSHPGDFFDLHEDHHLLEAGVTYRAELVSCLSIWLVIPATLC